MTLMAEPKNQGVQENGTGSASLAEAREAILSTYPNIEGQMIVRQVTKSSETCWYRVNWYKKGDFGMYIHHSRFLALRKTPDGITIEDQTIRPRNTETSLN